MDATQPDAPTKSRDHFLVALVFALGLGAAVGISTIMHWPALSGGFTLGLPMLVAMFAIAEVMVVHVPVREDEHTISFSEIPLVGALFYATPLATVVGQPLGTLVVLVCVHRQRGTKLAFNVVQTACQPLVAVLIFHAILGSSAPDTFDASVAALIAVCGADITSALLVTVALALHQGRESLQGAGFTIVTGAAGAACKGALGVLAVAAITTHGITALVPLALVIVPMWIAFHAYGRVHARLQRAELLYQFTQGIDGSANRVELETSIATQAAMILRAAHAELVNEPPLSLPTSAALVDVTTSNQEVASWLLARGWDQALLARVGKRLLVVADRQGADGSFDEDDVHLCGALANHAAVALENAQLIAEETHRAQHDPVTGLANRQHFVTQLERASHTGSHSLLVIALNESREIIESLGYEQGASVVAEAARRLQELVDEGSVLGRLGEDSFGLVVPSAIVPTVVVEIERRFSEAFLVVGLQLAVTSSIGIARLEPNVNGEHLVQRGEAAQRYARSEKTAVAHHDPSREAATPRRLVLAHQLHTAIREHELSIVVQPKASLRTSEIAGVEVLARWCMPDGTRVPPDEFVQVAEQTSLIHELTDEVFELALSARKKWALDQRAVPFAVNVSVRDLLDPRFVGRIANAFRRHGCPPHEITLEITETQAMSDPGRVAAALYELVALGLKISIDDFGTGFSSLVALRTLPLHEIKVDRTFISSIVTEQNDLVVARSTTDLGHSLGLTVTAEGAEDEATIEILRSLNIDLVQGWAVARPMPPEAFPDWLSTWRRSRTPGSRADRQPV